MKTRENVPRVTLLELYTNYAFDRTFRSRQSVHAALVSSFLLFLMEKKVRCVTSYSVVVLYFWFVFRPCCNRVRAGVPNKTKTITILPPSLAEN